MDANKVALAGNKYLIASENQVPSGKRAWARSLKKSDISDPGVFKTARWNISGPFGQSRESDEGFLGVDYTDNLEHRYARLLTSAAARNAGGLTAGTASQYLAPIADVTVPGAWTEGAGDADSDAFDELDDVFGAPDSDTTYWTTSTNDSEIILQMSVPTIPIPNGSNTFSAFLVVGRIKNSVTTFDIDITLYEGVTQIATTTDSLTGTTYQNATLTVSQSEMDSITDFGNLRLGVSRTSGTGNLNLTQVYVAIPDPYASGAKFFNDDGGYIFIGSGARVAQVDPADMSMIVSSGRGSTITDMVAEWGGQGLIARGSDDVAQSRSAITSAGSTYTDITSVSASRMEPGSDRLWIVDASGGADDGQVKFALGALTSANLSNPFQVADPSATTTGLHATGPYMMVAFDRGLNSFTSAGKAVRYMPNLRDFKSRFNGISGDEGFQGWYYLATQLGLYAISIEGNVVNPVGPGEGLAGQGFEGGIDGFPTAVKFIGENLFVAYLTTAGDTYIFRGTFGPDTAGTGRPEWFTFYKLSQVSCFGIGMTSLRTNPTLLVAEDDDYAWFTLGRRGRDIADANYVFDVGGGTWYGSTMMRGAGKLINVRGGKFFTENCDANNTWQLAVSMDEGSYVNVGSAVITDGLQSVIPTDGASPPVPLSTVSGSYLKSKLTQVAASSTAPPQLRGFLDIEYDERPETIEEHQFLIIIGGGDFDKDTEWTNLKNLYDRGNANAQTPQTFTLPEDNAVAYGFVTDISERIDIDGKGTQGVYVTLQEWPTS